MVDDTIRVTKIYVNLYLRVLQDIKQIRRFEYLCGENICFCFLSARNLAWVGKVKI
jgi:hypothetical protein